MFSLRSRAFAACLALVVVDGVCHAGTIVRFATNLGSFDVNLSESPALQTTVNNFLAYVTASSYANSIFHRSTTYDAFGIQIIQGGGYVLQGNALNPIPTAAPIPLQAGVANTRGTIAMARTSDPNSATSGWYFNVEDNPGLDFNYAVFGNVIDTIDNPGLSVIDAIASVPVYNVSSYLGPSFGELPLLQPSLDASNLVMVSSVTTQPAPSTVAIGVAAGQTVTQTLAGYPVISGTAPLVKTGAGTLVLSGSNTLTAPITILSGTVEATAASAMATATTIDVASGAVMKVSGIVGGYTVPSGQTLSGHGTIQGSVVFGAGATLSPGGSSALLAVPAPATLSVPEPSFLAIGGVGLGWLVWRGRRRRTHGVAA